MQYELQLTAELPEPGNPGLNRNLGGPERQLLGPFWPALAALAVSSVSDSVSKPTDKELAGCGMRLVRVTCV
jgi:hypothetical protein